MSDKFKFLKGNFIPSLEKILPNLRIFNMGLQTSNRSNNNLNI